MKRVSYTDDELAAMGVVALGYEDDEQIPLTALSEYDLDLITKYMEANK